MDLLDRMLKHDAWTTDQLLQISARLSDDELDHHHGIGHGTLRKTFEHMIWNMECWLDLMMEREVRNRSPESSVEAFRNRLSEVAGELCEFGREIVDNKRLDETFVDTLEDSPTSKTFGGTLVHLATHGMHHRAQLLYMLRMSGVSDLPEGDVLSWEAAHRVEPEHEPSEPWAIDSNPREAEAKFVDEQLERFNKTNVGRDDFESFNYVVRDEQEKIVAGMNTLSGWDWVYIQILYVAEEHRGKGLGTKLLHRAEHDARSRGVKGVCLSSFSFQAPAFYEAHGYTRFGEIPEYPPGESLFFFSKVL